MVHGRQYSCALGRHAEGAMRGTGHSLPIVGRGRKLFLQKRADFRFPSLGLSGQIGFMAEAREYFHALAAWQSVEHGTGVLKLTRGALPGGGGA